MIREFNIIDRRDWPHRDGPWMTEPDIVEWSHAGSPCVMVRHRRGVWQAFVRVHWPHPFYGERWTTQSALGRPMLTQEQSPARREESAPDAWWVGFACDSEGDFVPKLAEAKGVYRDEAYVRALTEQFAEQVAAYASGLPLPLHH